MVGSKPAPPLKNHISVEELFSYLNPASRVHRRRRPAQDRQEMGLDVLLLDVRSRAEFEAGRISGAKAVCIEPITLREGMSSADIEDKLVLSPPEEQSALASRNRFDLWCCTIATFVLSAAAHPPTTFLRIHSASEDDVLIRAIYENEFTKTLPHQPVLLVGGFERWEQKLGEKCIVRSAANGASAAEAGERAGLKRARRQHQVFADGTAYAQPSAPASPTTAASRTSMQPGGVYPSRASNGASSPSQLAPSMADWRPVAASSSVSRCTVVPSRSSPPPYFVALQFVLDLRLSSAQALFSVGRCLGLWHGRTSTSAHSRIDSDIDCTRRRLTRSLPLRHHSCPWHRFCGGNDLPRSKVMAPGYAGHLSTQSSRMYASPTNGRSADEIKIGLTVSRTSATRAT